MAKSKNKSVQVDLPEALYEMFKRSRFRRMANTDAEGLRSLIRYATEQDEECQGENGELDRIAG